MSLLYKIDKATLVNEEEVQLVLPHTNDLKFLDILILRKNNLEEIMSVIRSIEQYKEFNTTIVYVGINPDLIDVDNEKLNEELTQYKHAEFFGCVTFINNQNEF